MKQLLNKPYSEEKLKKERIIQIINLYILESKTFENNESVTESLIKYRNGFSKSNATTRTIAELLDVKLTIMDRKEIDSNEINKIAQILKSENEYGR